MRFYSFSWFHIDADTRQVSRYIDPQASLMVVVASFDDCWMLI